MSVRVFAPAKINLTLKVARPRADGLHPLSSVVAFADVGDIVEVEQATELSLTIHGDFADDLAPDDNNLVLRAARALAQAAGVPPHARISLEKNLPIASGIGGGSADAAATLTALNKLWHLDWPPARLAELGAKLGADVPVFFSGAGAAHMSGIGEVCRPIALQPLAAVLVNPLQTLPTPDVYRAFDRLGLGSDLAKSAPPEWSDPSEAIAAMRALGNDLQPAAASLLPVINDIAQALSAHSAVRYAALSGSGATMFAIVDDWPAAERLADELIAAHPDWWIQEAMLGA